MSDRPMFHEESRRLQDQFDTRRLADRLIMEPGSLVMELHPWYGSAALMMVNEVHSKIQKPRP